MDIVIRAGGVGTRLWPVSRNTKPKQLHALTSHKTLLQEAIERVLGVVSPEHIFVSCNQQSEQLVRAELGAILEHNLIIEPALRDTAAAIGLETITLARRDPQAVIVSLGSDHVITDTAEFQRVLKLAVQVVEHQPDQIVCIGIKPDRPDTGYGYIEIDDVIAPAVHRVRSFTEKPNQAKAQEFLRSGRYLWNANMFVWRADTLLQLYRQHMPQMYQQLLTIQQHPDQLATVYPQVQRVAVDYAIIEKAEHILAIPGNFGWNDIGDWARLKDELVKAEADNYSRGDHIDIDSKNCLVFSETKRFIATIGTTNLMVIDTPDALLVCDKFHSQQVKDIVDRLKQAKRTELL